MKDYRPISCCNVMYKVISKILANRLKVLLPTFIAPNQSAFVKDRLLTENVLLASELVKGYHKDTPSPRCAIQIDISKAFDSVQWEFILHILAALHIPDKFIHWIRLCITTPSFSVQVNGELAGYFQSTRGLRQGCSLSPYLFVISMHVLSKLLDDAAAKKIVGFHPKCEAIRLTHLCFADDLMIFSDGSLQSLEGIIAVFDSFARLSGLKISLEKSTLYLSGVSALIRQTISARFPIQCGSLPVRYLGLPLLTKRMNIHDCAPLLDSIKHRFSSWTARSISYAGRLQLIQSVIESIINFWMSAYCLPSECIHEIEKLCAAFLWSGPSMNPRRAKIAWHDLCTRKDEGGLGLRKLKDVNRVCVMKLLWRIISATSLWVNWVKVYLIQKASFWSIPATKKGSWIWEKILKCRVFARTFVRVEVGNGERTSFWHDDWSLMGPLMAVTGPRGYIDLGISDKMTIRQVLDMPRRRRHRQNALIRIEKEITRVRVKQSMDKDRTLWRANETDFKAKFNSATTLSLIREHRPKVPWAKGLWFQYHTPKFAFMTWLAIHNRLSTTDRMVSWDPRISTICVLCKQQPETRDHLFFLCPYSSQIWAALGRGIFGTSFTNHWNVLLHCIAARNGDRIQCFIRRYIFQATLYHVWRERNQRRHGGLSSSPDQLIGEIDNVLRNRFMTIRSFGDGNYEEGTVRWLQARLPP